MKLFLDTANIDEIRKGAEVGRHFRALRRTRRWRPKKGIGGAAGYRAAVQEIADIIDGPISVEVVSTDGARG